MRNTFATVVAAQSSNPDLFFLSGDLGFMALEGVREAFGNRFINAGIAEQNMVGVAAGLAREGLKVYIYSIAPFCYARPFEQIRNDICFQKLPVCLVGNGGGYAYGHMGPTHHALEDCAAMRSLGVRVLVPAFNEDLWALMGELKGPTYLRLGYDERPKGQEAPTYAPWRQILAGDKGVLVALGPLAGLAWQALESLSTSERPAVWAVTELDEKLIPPVFLDQIRGKPLYVIEEHVAAGGLGMHVSLAMAHAGVCASRFVHNHALGYPTGRYGSQEFHRKQCGLDVNGIRTMVG